MRKCKEKKEEKKFAPPHPFLAKRGDALVQNGLLAGSAARRVERRVALGAEGFAVHLPEPAPRKKQEIGC